MTREEAIKSIKLFFTGLRVALSDQTKEALNVLIPELCESEDEMIRKEMVDYFSQYKDDGLRGVDITPWIAYLEKQKETLPIPNKFSGLKSLMLQYLQSAANRKDDVEIESDTDLWGRKILDYVWKYSDEQKEQKSTEWDKLQEDFRNINGAFEDGKKEVVAHPEKYGLQKEQKPVMIQWTGKNLKKVIDFTGKSPRFDEWFKSWEEFEDYVHSHDDILKLFCEDGSHYEVPVGAWIVKTPDGYNIPSRFRFIQKPADDKDFEDNAVNVEMVTDPKTGEKYPFVSYKDQLQKPAEWSYPYGENETVDRLVSIAECLEMDGDCLFNGYTGTECGKFLRDLARKQVECKPAEWSEEDETKLRDVVCLIEYCGHVKSIREHYKKFLTSLPERFNLHPEQWSEEDKRMLLSIINAFRNGTVSTIGQEQWLKSLPERFVLQPKQVWSEEDDNTLECSDPLKRFVDMVHSVDKSEFTEFEYSIINFVLACCDKDIVMTPKGIHCYAKTILDIVKKEFPQKNCGWTDEEETVLHNACEFIHHRLNDSVCRNGSIGGMDYNVLYEKLKSIKDRVQSKPRWKPSKEQIDLLRKVYSFIWADPATPAEYQDGLGDFIDQLKTL